MIGLNGDFSVRWLWPFVEQSDDARWSYHHLLVGWCVHHQTGATQRNGRKEKSNLPAVEAPS